MIDYHELSRQQMQKWILGIHENRVGLAIHAHDWLPYHRTDYIAVGADNDNAISADRKMLIAVAGHMRELADMLEDGYHIRVIRELRWSADNIDGEI